MGGARPLGREGTGEGRLLVGREGMTDKRTEGQKGMERDEIWEGREILFLQLANHPSGVTCLRRASAPA